MARAETSTLLPIDTWGSIMGINPWELNQIGAGFPNTNQAQCDHVFFQQSWQEDFLSREEVAGTIARAEEMLAEQLSFWPAPRYFVNEVHTYPRPLIREGFGAGGTVRGFWKSVQLNWGKVQGGGILSRTLIGAGTAVATSDSDGDGVKDLFTISQPTLVTDPDEISVYFATADRLNQPVAEKWRLRPITVVISGGIATITGHASMLVKPNLETIQNPQVLDVTVAGNFVTTADVYQVFRDVTTTTVDPAQGTAMWEVGDCATPPCAVEWVPMCIGARNAEVGAVSVDYWLAGANSIPSSREPDRVSVNYAAGVPLVSGRMDPMMADLVAHLATGILPVGPCGCERSDRIVSWWRNLPTWDAREGERPLSLKEIDECPFGQSRGALWAWRRVRNLEQVWATPV